MTYPTLPRRSSHGLIPSWAIAEVMRKRAARVPTWWERFKARLRLRGETR